MLFGDTFIKSAKAHDFSAVVDLDMLKKQLSLFSVLKGRRQFLCAKIAFFPKILLCSKSRDKNLSNEPY